MPYRPEVDGLRAVAVLSVILFHGGFPLFSGGFVGVDIFFVISGYLITRIIKAELEHDSFSLTRFYERRARRILPALYTVLLATILMSWPILLPQDMLQLSRALLSAILFASNIFFWTQTGYFAPDAELNPLLHTWSLGVEEQYYLIFPLIMLVGWRTHRRAVTVLLVAIALVSLTIAERRAVPNQSFAFYLLITRFWELLVGGFVAFHGSGLVRDRVPRSLREIGGLAGVALLAAPVVVYDKATAFPGLTAVPPTLGAALVILLADQSTRVGSLLSSKLLVGLGLISYSAYLWHAPLMTLARHRSVLEPSPWLMAGLTLVTFALAYLTWRYIETPFRDGSRVSRTAIVLTGVLGAVGLGALGGLSEATGGFHFRLSPAQREILATTYDADEASRFGTCFLMEGQTRPDFAAECSSEAPEYLVWGDSHAAALSIGLRKQRPDLAQFTAVSCPPFGMKPACRSTNAQVVERIQAVRPASILMHVHWASYWGPTIDAEIKGVIDLVRRISPRSRLYLVGPGPQWQPSLPVFMVRKGIALDSTAYIQTPLLPKLAAIDAKLAEIAGSNGVGHVSLIDILCRTGACRSAVEHEGRAVLLVRDYGHLTQGGSTLVARELLRVR